jgi:hypothetical protein
MFSDEPEEKVAAPTNLLIMVCEKLEKNMLTSF